MDRLAGGDDAAASVGVLDRVGSEQLDHRLDLAVVRRPQEGGGNFALAVAVDRAPAARVGDPVARPPGDLPGVGRRYLEGVGDVGVVEVEGVAEDEDGALDRIEPLQGAEQRQVELLGLDRRPFGIVVPGDHQRRR